MSHRHARIEEAPPSPSPSISSSASDPSEMDPSDYTSAPTRTTRTTTHTHTGASYRSHRTLYPIYFDATRSRREGRRVSREMGVRNPLARELVEALRVVLARGDQEDVKVVFEPGKCHPRDWANPGRVKVLWGKGAGVRNSAF